MLPEARKGSYPELVLGYSFCGFRKKTCVTGDTFRVRQDDPVWLKMHMGNFVVTKEVVLLP
jgi:hypothetical protein